MYMNLYVYMHYTLGSWYKGGLVGRRQRARRAEGHRALRSIRVSVQLYCKHSFTVDIYVHI